MQKIDSFSIEKYRKIYKKIGIFRIFYMSRSDIMENIMRTNTIIHDGILVEFFKYI